MTYQEALNDEQAIIAEAIERDDDTTLRSLAYTYAKRGDDEWAEYLLAKARQAYRNNWAYDEAVDNSLC